MTPSSNPFGLPKQLTVRFQVLRELGVGAFGRVEVLPDLLDRIEGKLCLSASVRMDAGFQGDSVYSVLEKRKTPYVGHLKPNATLNKLSAPYLVWPYEIELPKEPRTWFYEFGYCVESWSRFRRAILVVLEKPCQL
jgi:hypothetical protein